MAYSHVQAARECRLFTKKATRLLLFTLASAMDKDKDTCFWSLDCIIHYSLMNKKTAVGAMNEIEESGIITRHKSGRGNRNFYRWHREVIEPHRELYRQEEKTAQDEAPDYLESIPEDMGDRAKGALLGYKPFAEEEIIEEDVTV